MDDVLQKLLRLADVMEHRGDLLVRDAMSVAHYKDTLLGVWWYRLSDGYLEYSKTATTHQDFDVFSPPNIGSRGWVRGRLFKTSGKVYIVLYAEDFPAARVPGRIVNDLYRKITDASGLTIFGVVDEEGYDLLNEGKNTKKTRKGTPNL